MDEVGTSSNSSSISGSISGSSAGRGGDYDDEPVLKYQRMGADVGKLLSPAAAATETPSAGTPPPGGSKKRSRKEVVVRMTVHDTCLVLGMATGTIVLTDYHGNETRRLRPHTKPVTDLSMDITGDFLARRAVVRYTHIACSEDGTVVVTGLQPGPNGEQATPEVYSYGAKWPMLAVKLDPLYARRKDKMFVAGGAAGKLLLNKKGWLGNDEIVLHKGEGPVSAIAWRGLLVAWASDGGLKIMDVDKGKAGERISYVDKPRSLVEFKEHECRCHMLWETPTRLLVGWGDTVMFLQILVREPKYQRTGGSLSPGRYHHHQSPVGGGASAAAAAAAAAAAVGGGNAAGGNNRRTSVPLINPIGGGLPLAVIGAPTAVAPALLEAPERYTQTVAVWQSDCLLCGISPFDSDTLILLGYPVEEQEDDDEQEEDDEQDEQGEGWSGGGEEGDKERVWGGAKGVFQPEVQLVKRQTGEVVSADTVPLRGWETAGAGQLLLRSTCWSTSSYRQDKEGATTGECDGGEGAAPRHVPHGPGRHDCGKGGDTPEGSTGANTAAGRQPVESPRGRGRGGSGRGTSLHTLNPRRRESSLSLRSASPAASPRLPEATPSCCRRPQPPLMPRQILSSFQLRNLPHSVGLGGSGGGAGGTTQGQYAHVFRMIEQHSLYDTVQERVLQLIRLDKELTGELLLRHPEKFSISSVVDQLKSRDLQHWYLGLLFDRSPEMYGAHEYAPFHALQVSLLAEFAAPFERGRPPAYNSAFLRFLRDSGFAPLEAALRECGKRRPPLYDEMAYILGRMGDTRRALTILLEEVCSVPRAIEFVEAHDKDLWYRLIEHSLKNEAFLSGLLDHAGVYDVDLARLVAEIPKGMHIPGLRDKLVKIISDYHFQVRHF
ncbi:unnamed protein product [Pylaiella littoralis]